MASGDVTQALLSGSSNGRPISVTATGTPGTTIHTPTLSAPNLEFVTLFATNISGSAVDLTIEFGGTTSPGDTIVVTVPSKETMRVVDRWPLEGASRVVRAFAGTTAVINITGYVSKYEAPE